MIAVFLVCLLSEIRSSAAEAELPPPQDLTMLAINTNYTLRWNYAQSAAMPNQVTFTTEFMPTFLLVNKKKPHVWRTACKESPEQTCDLTNLDLYYYTIFKLRVRASANGIHSPWAVMDFCPETDAGIGPPSSVNLAPAGSNLEVVIVDPLTSANSSMREYIKDLKYNILYWEQDGDEQALVTKTISVNSNVVALPDLKPFTWYCVKVQSYTEYDNKNSSFTSPVCMNTDGHPPCWQIILIFLAFLVIVAPLVVLLIVGSFKCSRILKSMLHPQLPSFLLFESLRDPITSKGPQLIPANVDSEQLWDVAVCMKSPKLERLSLVKELAAPPSGQNLDTRLLRQTSSGSTDSGVYSTGGTSGNGAPDGVNRAVDFLPVKLKDKEAGLNSCLIAADEGINEM
ncbi:interleukin-10 receptor subunit beta [Oryzias melastigma]|uniref:Interferon alpha/beta receptor 1a-like n=1 Tax=Oryzias melastigma TaxID=30732 RepID=A0A3B3BXX4_ORYME|nr:interleukin-10 receptor subunit beta [Oryzias melastigma]